MPASTYPDLVSIYGFQSDDVFPVAFMSMIKEIQPRSLVSSLQNSLYDVLESAANWSMSLNLTAQPLDLSRVPRPYDCDDLVDFFLHGATTFDPREQVCYRHIPFAEFDQLVTILMKVFREPLFPEEKEEWEKLFCQIEPMVAGNLISVYAY